MASEALRVSDIDAYSGDSHVLRGVSVALQQGRLLELPGRNGVGKTTRMREYSDPIPRGPHHENVCTGQRLVGNGRRTSLFKWE